MVPEYSSCWTLMWTNPFFNFQCYSIQAWCRCLSRILRHKSGHQVPVCPLLLFVLGQSTAFTCEPVDWSLYCDSWQLVETKLTWLLSFGIPYHMLLMSLTNEVHSRRIWENFCLMTISLVSRFTYWQFLYINVWISYPIFFIYLINYYLL